MRAATLIAFPFAQTFRRLELENRWWHRLSVVLFFTALLSAGLVSAGLCYLTFAPQVKTPEIWLTVAPSTVQSAGNVKPGDPIPTDATIGQPASIPSPPDGSAIVDAQIGAASGKQYSIPIPPGATIDGQAPAKNDPGDWIDVPPGFVLDNTPGSKTVQMPDGTTATFPGSMSDDAIKARWIHLKHRQLLSAIFFAGLIAMFSTLILSYALQAAYRVLLYVIFGRKLFTPTESATA